MSAFDTGPYISGAFICERVLTEQDGVNTYVRVIDRFVRGTVSPERPTELPPHPVNVTLAILFKPGSAIGPFEVALEVEKPSGERLPGQEFTVHFTGGPAAGVNAHLNVQFLLDQQGLWWIDVFGGPDRKLMTRVSMELQDQWIKGQLPQDPSAQG